MFEATNTVRRLIEFNPEVVQTATSTNFHSLILGLLNLIESLRSSVSKNALICLNELIIVMNRQIESES